MQKVIQIRDAVLKTLKVEVKSLTISGKQMTLAVFRQLVEEPLINVETGELKGVPWGTVNYYWGDCKPLGNYNGHLHVVWQKGDELRRSCECAPQLRERRLDFAQTGAALILAYREKPDCQRKPGKFETDKYSWPRWMSIEASKLDPNARKLIEGYPFIRPYGGNDDYVERARADHEARREKVLEDKRTNFLPDLRESDLARVLAPFDEAAAQKQHEEAIDFFSSQVAEYQAKVANLYRDRYAKDLGWPLEIEAVSPDDAARLFSDVVAAERARFELHQKNFAALETMDQLFIAV